MKPVFQCSLLSLTSLFLAFLNVSSAQVPVPATSAPKHLFAELKSKNADERRRAAIQLGTLRARDAVRPLLEGLLDAEPTVREAAAFAVGQIADRSATTTLMSNLSDRDQEVRASIVFALGMLGDRKAIPRLSNLLDDDNVAVRSGAVVALGLMQDDEAVDEIIGMLNDPSFDVRYDAVWALGQIGEPDALEHLSAVLVNLDLVKVNDSALEALRQAVQNSMEVLESQREVRSGVKSRPRRATTNPKDSERVEYSMELRPVRVVQSVQPAATERASRTQITGTVGVRALVAVTGRVARAYVTRRLGYGLDQRAMQAVMQYQFSPAMRAGMPQTSWIDVEVKY
jgi:TonB family protein